MIKCNFGSRFDFFLTGAVSLFKLIQRLLTAFLVMSALVLSAHAQENFAIYEKEYLAAKQSLLEGHVKDGIDRMAALVQKVDPATEPNTYWLLSANLAEFLHHELHPVPKTPA